MVAFVNQFTSNVSQQYRSDVAVAEQFISSHWTNPITITLVFDAQASGTGVPQSTDFPSATVSVSYGDLRRALIAHADNPDAQAAVATLPATDPTAGYAGNHNWVLPLAYARMLGLTVAAPNDDGTIILNTSYPWTYGVDVIAVLEHEITEAAMGRVGGLGEQNAWSTLDLFRWSSGHLRDFTDGRDLQTTYFSVDGNTLLLPFHNQWSLAGRDQDDVGDFDALDVFGFGQNKGVEFSATDYKVMNVLGWTPPTITPGPLIVAASGDFDGNLVPDYIWRRSGDARMGMWSYSASPPLAQVVSTLDLGAVDFNWALLGSGVFTPGATTFQMLMDYVPSGDMTLWWVNNGQLTGIDLGHRWLNVGLVATGRFTNNPATGRNDLLVSNLVDHHLYDWWVGANGTLTGIDLGPAWSNVSLVATGPFTSNGIQNLLVSNNLDHHLYDWWIGANNTLQGIDLGPVWSNLAYVGFGPPMGGHLSFLVSNNIDHHLYDWWIGSNNTLQGIDLGPVWSNVQLVAIGQFDNNAGGAEMLVQNTVDHHLYEWWISAQNQLTGIDLGPYWSNVQLIDHGTLNTVSAYDQLLVRNTVDGHFYEWWVVYNQLTGIDLGPVGDGPGGAGAGASSAPAAGVAPLATDTAASNSSGAMSPAAPASAVEPASPVGPTMASPMINAGVPPTSADSSSLIIRPPASPVIVSASGDFDNNTIPDFIWRRPSDGEMGMWSYNGATQRVSTTDLGTVDFNWAVLGGAHYQGDVGSTASQILMDHVADGTMTLWWVGNSQLTGIDLGQRWNNIGFVATDPGHTSLARPNDFLVSNLIDQHLYDWWIDGNNSLQGVDFGPYWANAAFVGVGKFTPSKASGDFLVANTVDHHLYDWWMDPGGTPTLEGNDLGPVWSNVAYISSFLSLQSLGLDGFLVANTVDHHLYEWWIDFNSTLQGIDLGPYWSNVQLVASGDFGPQSRREILVQNTVDHHLYEWWISSQNQLSGIDFGPYWSNVQLIGHGQFNNNSAHEQLLVRNTVDGHFYQWWIANDQLQGVDLGSDLVAAASGNPGNLVSTGGATLTTNAAATSGGGATSPAPTSSAGAMPPAGATMASPPIDASLPSPSSGAGDIAASAPVIGAVTVVAADDFNSDGLPDFVWTDSSGFMSMWEFNPTGAVPPILTFDLGATSGWSVLGSAHYSSANGAGGNQMLMDYMPTGTMTLWWVTPQGQLTGLDLGQQWNNVGFVASAVPSGAPFNGTFSFQFGDFLVANLTDHHLYDWWVGSGSTLQGVDLGAVWSNVSAVAAGFFTFHGGQNLLVTNTLDHHLYDWWINPQEQLAGVDLGPVWSNVAVVAVDNFTDNPSTGFANILVTNLTDHHLYDWWIGSNNTLQGIDLGPYWSNVQVVATGQFRNNSTSEILVQNTLDHHLYDWWINAQGQLTGIDLGPYWVNVQLVGHRHYNNNAPAGNEELLVHNISDGHFYEWWIANNQLQGIDLGTGAGPGGPSGSVPEGSLAAGATALATNPAPTSTNGALPLIGSASLSPTTAAAGSAPISFDSTSLLVQSMASFGSSGALLNSGGALLGTDPSHQSALAAPTQGYLAHG